MEKALVGLLSAAITRGLLELYARWRERRATVISGGSITPGKLDVGTVQLFIPSRESQDKSAEEAQAEWGYRYGRNHPRAN